MNNNSEKNFWDLKPFWCQPWSIILFGITVMAFIWFLFQNLIITSLVSFCIIAWWVLFLILVPVLYEKNTMD